MFSLEITLLTTGLVLLGLAVGKRKSSALRHSLQFGIAFWKKWLPVAALTLAGTIVFGNLSNNDAVTNLLPLSENFVIAESVFLLVGAMAMFTQFRNIANLVVLSYLTAKIVFIGQGAAAQSTYILLLALFLCMGLSLIDDRLGSHPFSGARIHRILFLLVGFIGLCATTWSLFNLPKFNGWLTELSMPTMPVEVIAVSLTCLLALWLGIVFDITHRIMILPIALPTCLALAFSLSGSMVLVGVFATLCVVYSLSSPTWPHKTAHTRKV
jgi:hypothetical protein